MRNSLRTRYSLATGFFLLFILSVFYIGGRIVLVHLVKDAEHQIREIGTDINRIALHNTERIKRHVDGLPSEARGGALDSFLGTQDLGEISFAMRLAADGAFEEGRIRGLAGTEIVLAPDVAGYADQFRSWVRARREEAQRPQAVSDLPAAGIVHVRGVSVYCAIAPCPDGRFLVLGSTFSVEAFTAQVGASFGGMEMKVTNRQAAVSPVPVTVKRAPARAVNAAKPSDYGLAPLVSEAIDFYSGGFWKLGDNPFEAVYTIRDIAGNPVSMIAVSLPEAFSNAARLAIGRLTLFITLVGIVLVVPVFWFQSRMLLVPLARMTTCVKTARRHCGEVDGPHLDWKGDDEFAELADSVNALLEAITRRTKEIAEGERRQKALIDGLPDGLMVFSREHRLVSMIKQPDGVPPIPGFVEEMPIDVTVFGRDGLASFGTAIDATFDTDKTQVLYLEAGGRPHMRHFDLRLAPMGEFVLVIVRDITETVTDRNRRRAAETRLQHVQRQESLTLLAGSIAHDVNNILAAVLNTVELAFIGEDEPEMLEVLNTIRDAVSRGSAMTRELMTFAGETKFNFERADPTQLVRDSQRLFQGVISANVRVIYDLPEDLPAVDVDKDQIWKVFFNLVKNAGEAMDGVGEVRISARRYEMTETMSESFLAKKLMLGAGVLISFTDNGPGIPPEKTRRIFDPYVSSKKSTGRGFGLATVASIIDAHHGGVRVDSVVGEGTTFGVFLPVSKTMPATRVALKPVILPSTPAAESAAAAAAGIAKRGVLLVDDDPAILKTTSILLKALKYTVYATAEREEAVELYRVHSSALCCVLLDAHLESCDPVRLISVFRAENPAVPVVVSSGSAPETAQAIFAAQPYDAFLGKPYTMADLKACLENASATGA